jgi:SurA-like protein
MRRARPAILLLLLGACTGAPSPSPAPSAAAVSTTPDPSRPLPLPLPEVVARVNGQPVRIQQILPIAKSALDKWKGAEREQHKPEALRTALQHYVDRELLLQEALSRGVQADTRQVDWNYDQLRREHNDDAGWASFLLAQGSNPQTFKQELRAQHTIAALLADESRSVPIAAEEIQAAYDRDPLAYAAEGAQEPPSFDSVRARIEASLRQSRLQEVQARLLERLRAQAKIELYL